MARSPSGTSSLVEVVTTALDRSGAVAPYRLFEEPVGASNLVFRTVDAAGWQRAVRVASKTPGRMLVEQSAIAVAATAGVPVAETLYVGVVDVGGVDHSVMVSSWVDGTRLADIRMRPTDRSELVEEVATTLAAIHGVEVSGFGNLDADLGSPWPSFESWFVDEGMIDLDSSLRLASSVVPGAVGCLEQAGACLRGARASLPLDPPRMAHGDVSPNNLLVEGARVVAVLDWESVKGGHPALDFGWWDFVGGDRVITTSELLRAYRCVTGQPFEEVDHLRRLVRIRILVGHLAWCVRTGNLQAADSLTTDLTTALGERPL